VKCLVTGCAGFIGSHLADRLLANGQTVIGLDNFTTGHTKFLMKAAASPAFTLVRGDLLEMNTLIELLHGVDVVFHLAANADVRFGLQHPRRDLEQNTIATFNVLEAMRLSGVKRLVFSSTGSIYGEATVTPTPENVAFPIQTSLYGASKLACEGLIQAYCEGFGFEAAIFRFVSILGERYTHGHIIDFYQQLLQHSDYLDILGNGHQRKSYLYVQDCIDAMLLVLDKMPARVNIFNLGTDQTCEVNDSVRWITAHLGLTPTLHYSGGTRGWIGDNPLILLNCAKMRALGWQPRLNIEQAVTQTVSWLQANQWLLEMAR